MAAFIEKSEHVAGSLASILTALESPLERSADVYFERGSHLLYVYVYRTSNQLLVGMWAVDTAADVVHGVSPFSPQMDRVIDHSCASRLENVPEVQAKVAAGASLETLKAGVIRNCLTMFNSMDVWGYFHFVVPEDTSPGRVEFYSTAASNTSTWLFQSSFSTWVKTIVSTIRRGDARQLDISEYDRARRQINKLVDTYKANVGKWAVHEVDRDFVENEGLDPAQVSWDDQGGLGKIYTRLLPTPKPRRRNFMPTQARRNSSHLAVYPPDFQDRPLVYHGITHDRLTKQDLWSTVLVPPNKREFLSNVQPVDLLAGDDRYIFCRPLVLGRYCRTNFGWRTLIVAWDQSKLPITGFRDSDVINGYRGVEYYLGRILYNNPYREVPNFDAKGRERAAALLAEVANIRTEYTQDHFVNAWLKLSMEVLQGAPSETLREASQAFAGRALDRAGNFSCLPALFEQAHLDPAMAWTSRCAYAWGAIAVSTSLTPTYQPYLECVNSIVDPLVSTLVNPNLQENEAELLIDQPIAIADAAWIWLPKEEVWVRPSDLPRANRAAHRRGPLYLPAYRGH